MHRLSNAFECQGLFRKERDPSAIGHNRVVPAANHRLSSSGSSCFIMYMRYMTHMLPCRKFFSFRMQPGLFTRGIPDFLYSRREETTATLSFHSGLTAILWFKPALLTGKDGAEFTGVKGRGVAILWFRTLPHLASSHTILRK